MSDHRRTPSHRDVRPVKDLVTMEEAYEAMQFIDKTCDDIGELQGEHHYREYMIGATEAVGGLYSGANSMDRRKYEARNTPQYLQALEISRDASKAYFKLKARREAAALKIELYRTGRADKRAREIPDGPADWPSNNPPKGRR